MVTVDIDNEIYNTIKEIVQENNIEYPSINNFVNKALKEKIKIITIGKKEQE